jgi:predicted Zn-dependent peptidase
VIRRALLLAALLLPGAASAQERVVVRAEAGTPVVATEVLVAVGPADEPEGLEGITYVTARALTAPILPVLDSLAAQLAVEQHRDAVSFTVTAAPDNWEEATRTLLVALFRDPVDSVAVVRQRAGTVAELRGREASPADALAREVERAVHGDAHPWGRAPVGTAASVARLSVLQVDAFLREAFTADRAIVAIVGPVSGDAGRIAAPFLDPGEARTARVEPARPERGTHRRPYEAITAWVAAVYPFGPEVDEEAVRMIGRLALGRVSFGLLRPQVYDARVTVVRHRAGGELRLELVVPPGEVEAWGRRGAEAVEVHARTPLEPGEFAERLRRYRGERLLELETPEARARHLARRVLVGAPADPFAEIEALTPERLQRAARSLGRPVLVYLGPFEEEAAPAASR